MSNGRILRQLIKSGAATGNADFVNAAEEVIRDERAKNHHLLANDLERVLYGSSSMKPIPSKSRSFAIPNDQERGLPLLEIRSPVRYLDDVVLSDVNLAIVEEILLEQSRADVLKSHGLRPISKLLLCGPPGCGKTLTAEAIAAELSLELVIVRFDAVISSFLGETAANLRKIFDYLNQGIYVALFDEFDAIGKQRDDAGDHGELKRVVNSVLQMMDSYRGDSVLLAATNHERLLDRAIWRRFEEVIVLEKPTFDQIRSLMASKLRAIRHDLPLDDRLFVNEFTGFSHADIERILIRAVKAMVLKGREYLTVDMVLESKRREDFRSLIASKNKGE